MDVNSIAPTHVGQMTRCQEQVLTCFYSLCLANSALTQPPVHRENFMNNIQQVHQVCIIKTKVINYELTLNFQVPYK